MPVRHVTGLADLARGRLSYDAETGILTWLDPGPSAFETANGYAVFRGCYLGKPAGSLNKKTGYVQVRIGQVTVQVHRLIWAMVHGVDPEHDIDHWDMDRANNRLANLREATRSENCRNQTVRKNSKSGRKGVHQGPSGKWFACISAGTVNGKKKSLHLGTFSTLESAGEAYDAAARRIHGEFARSVDPL